MKNRTTIEPVPIWMQIEADNAKLRAEFADTYPLLTSEEVNAIAGCSSGNAGATATRWRQADRIFAVPFQGSELYPAFQFADDCPLPIIGEILKVLGDARTPWQTAFWIVSSNSWLDGVAPLDRFSEPGQVLNAARQEVGAVFG